VTYSTGSSNPASNCENVDDAAWLTSNVADVEFQPAPSREGGTVTLVTTPGIIYPTFQVQSIIYDTPGNKSQNGFQNTLSNGTTSSIGSSFTSGDTSTFSLSFGFLWGSSTLSWSYGNSTTNGNSTAWTNTISEATGVSNASNSSGPNAINHQQDLFIIWLNPAAEIHQTGSTSVSYGIGTQFQAAGDPDPGQPEVQDQVEVFAQAMLASSTNNNLTTVPVAILEPQTIDGQTLPGLAHICANPIYYPNSCNFANQCGCTPADFTPVLAKDPLLNYSSTESPLNADTSGATACACPTSSNSCRYIPVSATTGSCGQQTELLSGPDDVGGNIPVNTFVATDTHNVAQTFTESNATTTSFTWEQSWKFGGTGISLKNTNQWTWTDSESTGNTNGEANSTSVTLSSSTVGCYQEISLFEDTVYHTFVFQQPAGNTSCP
jgi:hypothetical protein